MSARVRTDKPDPHAVHFLIQGPEGRPAIEQDYFWLDDGSSRGLRRICRPTLEGKPRADDRRVISGIVHVLKSGCRWADAPEVYGPRKTLYNRFVRWAAKGV